jgi:hypothetical protein
MKSSCFEPGTESKEERKWREIELMRGMKKVFGANNILKPCVVVLAKDEQREA